MEAKTDPPAGSISFVVTSVHEATRVAPLVELLNSALLPDDEIILLLQSRHAEGFNGRPPGVRVVGIPDASIYRLRAHMPEFCTKSWVVLLEDHSMVDDRAVTAIRGLIRERPDIDLIPFLAKNLTSVRPWEWAIFLYTFAPVWAPLDHPPPFSAVTSAIIRRSCFEREAPIRDGEWELVFVPRLYASGRWTWSNEIFIDHVKPLSFLQAIAIAFHNARTGAASQLNLDFPWRNVLREGWYVLAHRPGELMRSVAARRHELPPGMRLRIHVIGFAHLLGNLAALLFGAGRSPNKLD